MYIVFPEVPTVDDRILACASWSKEEGCSDIQHDDVPVAGRVAVGVNTGLKATKLLVIQLLVFARRKVAPFHVLGVWFI